MRASSATKLMSHIDISSVPPATLKAAGLATRRDIPVKVLAKGSISKPLTVHAHGFSKTAREAIEAAGGPRDAAEIAVHVPSAVALYVLNHKRAWLAEIERRCVMQVTWNTG